MSKEGVLKEITHLHKFFEDWYNGVLPKDTKVFQENFTRHLGNNFQGVFPDGTEINKDKFCAMIFKDHNCDSSFKIKIVKLKISRLGQDVYLARYEEWQYLKGNIYNKRRTLSVFTKKKKRSMLWQQMHESPIEYIPG